MKLVSKGEAARSVGYHPESLMRLVRAGLFPACACGQGSELAGAFC